MKCFSHPFSDNEWFDPEQVGAMGAAFDNACASLDLSETNEHDAALVARKIIEAAKHGERNATHLYDIVMHWARAA